MKCNNCGIENSDENKFCTGCGSKLKAKTDVIYCAHCGVENDKSNNFCENCGSKLAKNKKSKAVNARSAKGRKRQPRVVQTKRLTLLDTLEQNKVLAVVLVLVLGFFVIQLFPKQESKRFSQRVPTNSLAGFAGSRVFDIASKFICSCGTCGELPLEECECPTAREEKTFIQSQINAKKTDSDIIKAVNAKYGWIKPQFQYLLSSTSGSGSAATTTAAVGNKIATPADKNFIVSQFGCPCGQCGIDKLIDCNCNHPRGAREVKRFIDNKIAQNDLTVNQIIDMVEKTYGSKL